MSIRQSVSLSCLPCTLLLFLTLLQLSCSDTQDSDLGKRLAWWVLGVHQAQTMPAPSNFPWSSDTHMWNEITKAPLSFRCCSQFGPRAFHVHWGLHHLRATPAGVCFLEVPFTFPLLHYTVVCGSVLSICIFNVCGDNLLLHFFVDVGNDFSILLS